LLSQKPEKHTAANAEPTLFIKFLSTKREKRVSKPREEDVMIANSQGMEGRPNLSSERKPKQPRRLH